MSWRSRKTEERASVPLVTIKSRERSPGGVVLSRGLTIKLKESFSARSICPERERDEGGVKKLLERDLRGFRRF